MFWSCGICQASRVSLRIGGLAGRCEFVYSQPLFFKGLLNTYGESACIPSGRYILPVNMFQIGGLLGLCLGFSLASIVEVVYWLGFRIWLPFKTVSAQVGKM